MNLGMIVWFAGSAFVALVILPECRSWRCVAGAGGAWVLSVVVGITLGALS